MMHRTFVAAAAGETATNLLEAAAFTTDSEAARRLTSICRRRGSPLVGTLPTRATLFCEATESAYGTPEHVLSAYSLAPLYFLGMHPFDASEAGRPIGRWIALPDLLPTFASVHSMRKSPWAAVSRMCKARL